MLLTLAIHPIMEFRFATKTCLNGAALSASKVDLRRLVLEDASFDSVAFEIARPGESLRAGPVFDIVEPRAKEPGGSPGWPGILGAPRTAGAGTTHVLEGAAVTLLREKAPGDSRGATGYVLEMSGAPAAGSQYASLHHLVIVPRTKPNLPEHARQRAYRLAQLKAAVYLARAGFGAAPARSEIFDLSESSAADRAGLPRVAYVGQIFSRQRKPETDEPILYGTDTDGMLPVLLHPNEWLPGAVGPLPPCFLFFFPFPFF